MCFQMCSENVLLMDRDQQRDITGAANETMQQVGQDWLTDQGQKENSLLFVSRPQACRVWFCASAGGVPLYNSHILPHPGITDLDSVEDPRANRLLDNQCHETSGRHVPVSFLYCHCLLTQIFHRCYQCLMWSQADKSDLVNLWRSCGWMNDLWKGGKCGSDIVDLLSTLNGGDHACPSSY